MSSKRICFFTLSFIVISLCAFLGTWIDFKYPLFHGNVTTRTIFKQIFMKIDTSVDQNTTSVDEVKIILLWTAFYRARYWWFKEGNVTFIKGGCQETRCTITNDRKYENSSSAIMFHMRNLGPKSKMPHRNYNQYWIFTIFESPVHTYHTGSSKYIYVFNKTLSYIMGSDFYHPRAIVLPKEKVTSSKVPVDAINRTKLILWYVSNCGPRLRRSYAKELSKYVPVDIFGRCGKKDPCRGKSNINCTSATKLRYKFYLAFENSRCPGYITEKFWWSLRDGIVPIVLGPKIGDYEQIAPPHSFIHVDNFTSPKHLSEYVKYLDKNDDAYYEYHMWRNKYRISLSEANFQNWCKLCSMLHQPIYTHENRDVEAFWSRKKCF